MESLKGWILTAVALSFAAGLTAGVAGTRVWGPPVSSGFVEEWGAFIKHFKLEYGLDARQSKLFDWIMEKHYEEKKDLVDREVLPETIQAKRDSIGAKTDQRIYKILTEEQQARYRARSHDDRPFGTR